MTLSLKNVFLNEVKKPKVWYHGSGDVIDKFSIEFSGKGNDQEGPGIYFTSSKKDALSYGNNVILVKIEPRKLVPSTGRVPAATILSLMKKAPYYEETLTDWDEDKNIAEKMALKSILNFNGNPQEVFQTIWAEFYRTSPIEYLKQMTKLGYDGHIVQKNYGVQHLILYNPNVIKHKKHI